MSKKVLIFGLFLALMASLVGGASVAKADWPGLYCTPSTQSVASGQYVSFTAYSTGYSSGQLTWTANSGTPTYGYGQSFGTTFYTSGGVNETRLVTVTDGYNTATCTVYVYNTVPTYTPAPNPTVLNCSPSYSTANSGDLVSLNAWGGNGTYSWNAANGTPTYGWGSSFQTRFYNYGSYAQNYTVSVTSNGLTSYCNIMVNGSATPTPTPYYGTFSMNHTVRNITRNTEGTSVNAYAGDRLQFVTTITTGGQQVLNFTATDALPSSLHYVSGSTTVNGTWYADSITGSGLSLGTLSTNSMYTIRFDATVDSGSSYYLSLSNLMTATATGVTSKTLTTNVMLNSSWLPTPTPYVNGRVELTSTGRNVARGQTGEYTSLSARGGDTLDLIVRIHSTRDSYLSNVYITDLLPSGVYYISDSTTVNGNVVADGITSSGINIGTLAPGAETTVKFSVRVNEASLPTSGYVIASNVAQVRADSLSSMSSQLSITMGRNLYISNISSVKTGPGDTLWLSLLIAMLVTGAYALYTRTDLFGRRMALAEIKSLSSKSSLNFAK